MKIDRIENLRDLRKLKQEWYECLSLSGQDSIFLAFDWFFSWWKSFGNGGELRILIFRDSAGSLNGIAPLCLKDGELGFLASREVTDYCDLIVRRGIEEDVTEAFLREIGKNICGADRLNLINIKEDSPTLPLLVRIAGEMNLPCTVRDAEVSLRLVLPGSYQSFLASLSRKNRHEFNRKLRKIESEQGCTIRNVSGKDEIQVLLESFMSLHRRSGPAKAGFWLQKGMSGFFRDIVSCFSRLGWVEFDQLSIHDETAALLLAFHYHDEILFYNIAYDPRFAAYSPGICLFSRAIERAIGLGKRQVDFLRGREKYKYNFGAKECKIKDFILPLREK